MFDNIYVIQNIIALAGGKIKGRKKIQNIVYILEQLITVFDKPHKFRWSYYGVFSEELASELSLGETFGILKESRSQEQRMCFLEVTDQPICSREKSLPVDLIRYLNSREHEELEIISSIIYFGNQGLDWHETRKRLLVFRGHLKDFLKQGFAAYNRVVQLEKQTPQAP